MSLYRLRLFRSIAVNIQRAPRGLLCHRTAEYRAHTRQEKTLAGPALPSNVTRGTDQEYARRWWRGRTSRSGFHGDGVNASWRMPDAGNLRRICQPGLTIRYCRARSVRSTTTTRVSAASWSRRSFVSARRSIFVREIRGPGQLTLVAIDQPTIVPDQSSMRPAERIAASAISWLGGGVQPANRARVGMFDDEALF